MSYPTGKYCDRRISFLLLTIMLVCGSSAAAQRADTLVKKVSAPRYAGVATLVPELRIGAADGPGEYRFGGPSELIVQKDGSIVVMDWAGPMRPEPLVRRYDAN